MSLTDILEIARSLLHLSDFAVGAKLQPVKSADKHYRRCEYESIYWGIREYFSDNQRRLVVALAAARG
jgi:hypothetical protein